MKLKTLKDLDTYSIHSKWVKKTELKKEAIKWVKFLRKTTIGAYYSKEVNHIGCCNKECNEHTAETIMEMNNITEEDLK